MAAVVVIEESDITSVLLSAGALAWVDYVVTGMLICAAGSIGEDRVLSR